MGETPIYKAAKHKNSFEIVNYLLQLRAKLMKTIHGSTLLHRACGAKNNLEILKSCFDKLVCKVNKKYCFSNMPLHYTGFVRNDIDAVKLFLEYCADINAAISSGQTPLP